ncbi:DUF3826 domain-containing protein [Chitinophaga agrisoli]|nr:DUF3826 domain-containing protein [Chitinophaga agrisoli]
MTMIKKYALFLGGILFFTAPAFAQQTAAPDTAYTRAITQRADKIVTTLGITDAAKSTKVRDIIVQQYRDLNDLQMVHDPAVKAAKEQLKEDKPALEAKLKGIEAENDAKLSKLHAAYLAKLSANLTTQQVDQVKDGMTYGVVPLTYRVYTEILPNLTEAQKTQMMAWLVEAREHAMDAGSSDKKHAWFGKYKGRINNYLAANGIDMKQAEKEWRERKKAEAGK